MRRKLALVCIAAATVMTLLWFLFPRFEPLSLPNLPAKPVPNYVEKRRGPPPPPPPPPSWEEFVAKVNGADNGDRTYKPPGPLPGLKYPCGIKLVLYGLHQRKAIAHRTPHIDVRPQLG